MNNPYEAFYHGLVVSKLWLCENLESTLDVLNYNKPKVKILGGWHNVMSFMMVTRRPEFYDSFLSYDKDPSCKIVADQICDAWRTFEEPKITNITANVSELNFANDTNTIYINCSVDQFENSDWFNTIPKNQIVCMQTTDIIDENPKWEINQRTKDLTEFKKRYPLEKIYYSGSKHIKYSNLSYNRLMLIGYK